jgi:hypothetical protein
MNVKDVLKQLLVVLILAGTAKVMTGVERQPNSGNVVAKILYRVGIFAQATDLTLQADANTSRIPNFSQLLKMFNFLVERATMLSAGDRQRYDFGSFRKIANFFESLVIYITSRIDLDIVTTDIKTVRVADDSEHLVELLDDASRRYLIGTIIEFDFDRSEL